MNRLSSFLTEFWALNQDLKNWHCSKLVIKCTLINQWFFIKEGDRVNSLFKNNFDEAKPLALKNASDRFRGLYRTGKIIRY